MLKIKDLKNHICSLSSSPKRLWFWVLRVSGKQSSVVSWVKPSQNCQISFMRRFPNIGLNSGNSHSQLNTQCKKEIEWLNLTIISSVSSGIGNERYRKRCIGWWMWWSWHSPRISAANSHLTLVNKSRYPGYLKYLRIMCNSRLAISCADPPQHSIPPPAPVSGVFIRITRVRLDYVTILNRIFKLNFKFNSKQFVSVI